METSKIIIVTDMPADTGVGIFAYSLFNEIRKRMDRIEFLYTGYRKIEYMDGIKNYGQRSTEYGSLRKFLVKFSNEALARKLDIYKENNFHFCGTDYSLSRLTNNLAATVHDLYFIKPGFSYLKYNGMFPAYLAYNFNVMKTLVNLKRIPNITTISEVAKRQLKIKTGKESTVIHHWIDNERFYQRDKVSARKTLQLPLDKRIFLNVSGMGPNKNLELLTAFAEKLPEDSILLKVGYPVSSKRSLNVANVPAAIYPLLFNAADAYVHTSTFEGFGIPLIESLGSGLPVIAPDTLSSREVLGDAALYFKNFSEPSDLVDIVNNYFPSENILDLEAKSLKHADFFSKDKIIGQYIEFYKKSFPDFQQL